MSNNGTGGAAYAPPEAQGAPAVAGAGSIRERIFASKNKTYKSRLVQFFGETIEIRQPTLGDILDSVNGDNAGDAAKQGIMVLLRYAYAPGTNDRVFDEADEESLLSLPFGEDFNRVVKAFTEVTGTDVKVAEKNSSTTH